MFARGYFLLVGAILLACSGSTPSQTTTPSPSTSSTTAGSTTLVPDRDLSLIWHEGTSDLQAETGASTGGWDDFVGEKTTSFSPTFNACGRALGDILSTWANTNHLDIVRREVSDSRVVVHVICPEPSGFFSFNYQLAANAKMARASMMFVDRDGQRTHPAANKFNALNLRKLSEDVHAALTCSP